MPDIPISKAAPSSIGPPPERSVSAPESPSEVPPKPERASSVPAPKVKAAPPGLGTPEERARVAVQQGKKQLPRKAPPVFKPQTVPPRIPARTAFTAEQVAALSEIRDVNTWKPWTPDQIEQGDWTNFGSLASATYDQTSLTLECFKNALVQYITKWLDNNGFWTTFEFLYPGAEVNLLATNDMIQGMHLLPSPGTWPAKSLVPGTTIGTRQI